MLYQPGSGVVIQLGIYTTAEYIYVLEPDWRKYMCQNVPKIKQLPECLHGIDNWHFVGIDSDICSILTMLYMHPQANWVNAYIAGENNGFVTILPSDAHVHMLGYTEHENYGKCVLQVPKVTLSEIIQSFGFPQVDVLAMDVEGSEVDIIANYDWQIKPKYIAVEFHDKFVSMSPSEFDHLLACQGYALIHEELTNPSGDGEVFETVERQYLLYD